MNSDHGLESRRPNVPVDVGLSQLPTFKNETISHKSLDFLDNRDSRITPWSQGVPAHPRQSMCPPHSHDLQHSLLLTLVHGKHQDRLLAPVSI